MDDQNDILVSLPPGEASIDATIATIARIFIPRARQLAAVTATPWPTDYEHASPHGDQLVGGDAQVAVPADRRHDRPPLVA